MKKQFKYLTGEIIKQGDDITLSGDKGKIKAIIQPYTEEAFDYSCKDTGGVVLEIPKGLGVVVIAEPETDEDLVKEKGSARL